MNGPLRFEVTDGVGRITLNRPEARNAISTEIMQGLYHAVKQAAADARVRVILIRGSGGHFTAGGDVQEFRAHVQVSPNGRLSLFRGMIEQWINPTVRSLRECHQPVIASVQGACAGFGMSLMLACDLAWASEDAYFATGYAQIGTSPDGGATFFLPGLVGRRRAAELLLLGERIDARQALDLGLVSRVVPAADLDAEVDKLIERLRTGPRQAHAEIKRLLCRSPQATLDAQLQAEAESFARCAATGDFIEGVDAFLGKREPKFDGR